jgi:hypothetical protein
MWTEELMTFLFHARELFDLRGRGVVIISDRPFADCNFKLKVGDTIEFRTPEGSMFRTTIADIEICDPFDPHREFALLLPRQISKDMVPLGAEIWKVNDQHQCTV